MAKEQNLDNAIDLIDILRVLWKHKIMVFSLTILLTIIAGVVSVMLPKIYKITAIVEPGKGTNNLSAEKPEAIKEIVLNGVFDQQIPAVANLAAEQRPKWYVQIPKNTSLLEISVESDKPDQAVLLLNELLLLISARIDVRLKNEEKAIGNKIKLAEIAQKGLVEEIRLLTLQMRDTKAKIEHLEAANNNVLVSPSSDAVFALLFSNEILNQQAYFNKLQLKLRKKEQNLELAPITVDNARLKLAKIKRTSISKHPTLPNRPIKPNKALIIAIGFLLGLMFGTSMAFGVEHVQRVRK